VSLWAICCKDWSYPFSTLTALTSAEELHVHVTNYSLSCRK